MRAWIQPGAIITVNSVYIFFVHPFPPHKKILISYSFSLCAFLRFVFPPPLRFHFLSLWSTEMGTFLLKRNEFFYKNNNPLIPLTAVSHTDSPRLRRRAERGRGRPWRRGLKRALLLLVEVPVVRGALPEGEEKCWGVHSSSSSTYLEMTWVGMSLTTSENSVSFSGGSLSRRKGFFPGASSSSSSMAPTSSWERKYLIIALEPILRSQTIAIQKVCFASSLQRDREGTWKWAVSFLTTKWKREVSYKRLGHSADFFFLLEPLCLVRLRWRWRLRRRRRIPLWRLPWTPWRPPPFGAGGSTSGADARACWWKFGWFRGKLMRVDDFMCTRIPSRSRYGKPRTPSMFFNT